jgi:hypothetical protein
MGRQFDAAWIQELEAAERDSPGIPWFGWQGAPIRQPLHSLPGESQFYGPSFVSICVVVDFAIHVNSREQTRKLPVPECPADAAGMGSCPKGLAIPVVITSEGQRIVIKDVKFANLEPASLYVRVPPDEEDLISRT